MAEMKFFHNPRCSKSRQALQIINDRGVKVKIVNYLDEGLIEKDINSFFSFGLSYKDIIRKKEKEYEELSFDICDEKTATKALMLFPKLLERPILLASNKAVIGRPPENVLELL